MLLPSAEAMWQGQILEHAAPAGTGVLWLPDSSGEHSLRYEQAGSHLLFCQPRPTL